MLTNPKSQILKETLADWEDPDLAAYKLACALGVFPPEDGSLNEFRNFKWMFWGANSLGDSLGGILDELAKNQVLKHDETTMKFKWNADFDPSHRKS